MAVAASAFFEASAAFFAAAASAASAAFFEASAFFDSCGAGTYKVSCCTGGASSTLLSSSTHPSLCRDSMDLSVFYSGVKISFSIDVGCPPTGSPAN